MKRNFGFTPHEGGGKYGFISYKSEDEKLVAPYAKALHDKGVKLWYDYGIPPGEDWFQTISQYIVESSFVILFITERVFRSSVIHIEIQTAEMWDIPVIPVFLESISRSSIPKGSASFYAKLALKQGVDRAWSMSVRETSKSIYELIAPIMASDTEEKIEQRGRLLERRTSLTPDVNNTPMVQSAISEVKSSEKELIIKQNHNSSAISKPQSEKKPYIPPMYGQLLTNTTNTIKGNTNSEVISKNETTSIVEAKCEEPVSPPSYNLPQNYTTRTIDEAVDDASINDILIGIALIIIVSILIIIIFHFPWSYDWF